MTNPNESGQQGRIRINNPREKISIPGSNPLASRQDIFTDQIVIKRATEIPLSSDWDNIPQIGRTRSINVDKSEDLVFVVELPLYEAARMLYDAGITTTESNAHFDPGYDEAKMVLVIKWDSLNESQRNAAEKLCREEPDKWKHYSAAEYGDHYEIVSLSWTIKKTEVTPREVRAYVNEKVKELIKGRTKIRNNN